MRHQDPLIHFPWQSMLFYFLDLAGVAVFAASGVRAAHGGDLDLLGIVVVAAMTSIGGGTLRDLLLDRHPIFWITDAWYIVAIIAAAMLTVAYVRFRPPPGASLLVADAFGLVLFAFSGTQVAQAAQCPPLIVVVALRLLAIRWRLHLPVVAKF